MNNSHWSTRFPHIVPVWHSLSQRNIPNLKVIDPNLEIDFGGVGVFNDVIYKNVTPCQYEIGQPMLPYFVQSERSYSHYIGNCLTYCRRKKILFSSKFNRIYAHHLNESNDGKGEHLFTYNQHSTNIPFHKRIIKNKLYKDGLLDKKRHYLELKVVENDEKDQIELLSIARESLKLFTYDSDENDFHLDLNIGFDSPLFPTNKSCLNFVDRNDTILEEYLVGFLRDSRIYRWNVESNTMFTDNDLNLDFTNKIERFIGLQWAVGLNPFLYFYGTHAAIGLCDTRLDLKSNRKPSLVIAEYEKFIPFHGQEMFHSFITCRLEPNQVITSSDFKINFLDIRYPNANIFQTKDMFVWNDTNKLCRSSLDNRRLFLLASNSKQCCLHSFEIGPELQPKQQHLPFHINLPHDIDAIYPTLECESNYFFQGIAILPFVEDSCFSVALLLNSGDIFIQEFRIDSNQRLPKNHSNYIDLADYKYENNVGKKVYINNDIDDVTLSYLQTVKDYIDHKNIRKPLQYSKMKCLKCKECFKEKKTKCIQNEKGFCLCLSSHLIEKEKELIEEDSSEDENERQAKNVFPSTIGSEDVKLQFTVADELDLDLVKDNWYHLKYFPDKEGVRLICGKLTVKLFDRWVNPSENVPTKAISSASSSKPSTSSMSID